MSQYLYLVRHGEAIPRGSPVPDEHRWLTERGRRRFYRAARRFARKLGKGRVEAILTSPLPRAVMTAELLARALRMDGPVEVRAELAPGPGPEAALNLLRAEQRQVAAVGHEPTLSQILRDLTGAGLGLGEDDAIPKGGIVTLRLDQDRARARLRKVIVP